MLDERNEARQAERLAIKLEATTLRALQRTWDELNLSCFKGRLRRPALELSDGHNRLGLWLRDRRAIRLSRALLLERGWGVLVEVLKHEMAHQFVDEALGLVDVAAHGPAFRRVCEDHGIDARASGVPTGRGGRDEREEHVLQRVARLLALAQSPNEHEARSAAAAAQRLMLKYNLDVARDPAPRAYAFRHLGRPTGRVDECRRILSTILSDHFFVETIWVPVWRSREGKRGSVLEVVGTPANLDLADYVHVFLEGTAERLWREHKRELGLRRDRERRTYLAGVMTGFAETLGTQRTATREEGLVWVGDSDLRKYLRRRHPHIRWTRYSGNRRTAAWAAGKEAGRKIVLRKGVSVGPSAGARPLLPGHS